MSFRHLNATGNPVSAIIQVMGVIPGERVMLTDMFGKSLLLSSPATTNLIQLDVAHLQPGMYVISTGNRKIKVQKK
ncbi:T9SS type A sorting domain-containing protein [Niastella yeongjuensis]|uniref:T9SS type A sorting domain-containing protein n=1 Tax=Niastella yeongjuensis TaxID=354355 RepID=UPI003CC8000B